MSDKKWILSEKDIGEIGAINRFYSAMEAVKDAMWIQITTDHREGPYYGSWIRYIKPFDEAEHSCPGSMFHFQQQVYEWVVKCFGLDVACDKTERNHRFLEEALELVQATGSNRATAHQIVDYVFDRKAGLPEQEVGGVLLTLAAFCVVHGIEMQHAGRAELDRVWRKIEEIRMKQAAKPKFSEQEPPDAR